MWDSNPRGLSTTDLAGLPHTRLGEPRHFSVTSQFALFRVVFCLPFNNPILVYTVLFICVFQVIGVLLGCRVL